MEYQNNKPNHYLNEYSYNQVKIANENAFCIMKDFINKLSEKLFSYSQEYIIKPKQVINLLYKVYLSAERNFEKVKECLEMSINEVSKKNGVKETYRYYNADNIIIINSEIYYNQRLLEVKCKEISKFLTDSGNEEKNIIQKSTDKMLQKLQKNLLYSIDNDPTI